MFLRFAAAASAFALATAEADGQVLINDIQINGDMAMIPTDNNSVNV